MPEIRATLAYVVMTLGGILIAFFPMIDPSFSLDLISLNLPIFIFLLGSVVSIMGLHEVCHCLYCQIKGVRILGVLRGLKDIGIKVEKPYPPGVLFSSLFSIPIVAIVSVLLDLPLWIVLFNTGVAYIYCTDDIKRFLRARAKASLESP